VVSWSKRGCNLSHLLVDIVWYFSGISQLYHGLRKLQGISFNPLILYVVESEGGVEGQVATSPLRFFQNPTSEPFMINARVHRDKPLRELGSRIEKVSNDASDKTNTTL